MRESVLKLLREGKWWSASVRDDVVLGLKDRRWWKPEMRWMLLHVRLWRADMAWPDCEVKYICLCSTVEEKEEYLIY